MSPSLTGILIALGVLVAIPVGIVAVIYLIVPVFKAIGFVIAQLFRFITGELGDLFRLLGAIVTSVVFVPIIALNVLIGRWSAASHYGRAFTAELRGMGGCLYRMAVGHPARLLCLTSLTEGIEQRLPEAIAQAPTADRPARAKGQFEGYTIVGSLTTGGSGGKLYIAEPDAIRRAGFEREGFGDVGQVVIKTFSLKDGSSLPQIVRESRALEAAKRLGLVLDHELTDERFYYVMRYVPGDSLSLATQRLHAMSGPEGLDRTQLALALGFGEDLLRTLDAYHRGGLWHKDVKPDNIIIDGPSAHLVDFGLVTPLRSGMTLTTHGTEYFRDPEMVRMALKGVKVHEVDGAKFDVYAAGAVLYSMVENSFPAHGGLSQIGKRCPEALRWIVRRAMTDYDKRYPTAAAMLADLAVLRSAVDPYAVKPVDLPSMRGSLEPVEAEAPQPAMAAAAAGPAWAAAGAPADGFRATQPPQTPAEEIAAAAATIGAASMKMAQDALRAAGVNVTVSMDQRVAGSPVPPTGARRRPNLRVTNWWSGGYETHESAADAPGAWAAPQPVRAPAPMARPLVSPAARRPAKEQLASARERAQARRARAQTRAAGRRAARPSHAPVNFGVVLATMAVGGLLVIWAASAMKQRGAAARAIVDDIAANSFLAELPEIDAPTPPEPPALPGDVEIRVPVVTVGSPDRPTPRVIVGGVDVTRGPAATTRSLPAVPPGVTTLVMSDVQPPSASIVAAIDRLRAAGFELIGNIPGQSGAASMEQASVMEIEADAKYIRGTEPLDDPAVRETLAQWVADHPQLGALVWFGRTGGEHARTQFMVVAGGTHDDAGVVRAASECVLAK